MFFLRNIICANRSVELVEVKDKSKIPEAVQEEIEMLDGVLLHIRKRGGYRAGGADYDSELIELRDAIAEAKPEDVAPLVEHMTRLQSLAAQRGMGEDLPVDPACPYFGHMRMREDGATRDVLVGKHTYLAPEEGIRIVDWRNAPVSRMYYTYDKGDDYEEEFGGRVRRGIVESRRSVSIFDSVLRRVADADNVFAFRAGAWAALDPSGVRLAGGQGTATRAEGLRKGGVLGVDADGTDRKDKHLPEIAALLDKDQFNLISSPSTNLLVVKGGAGSGKTTVGLHRIAYLVFSDPNRFKPKRILVAVLNQALASYISQVLPALGVEGVNVMTFAMWARNQRIRHIPGLPKRHSEDTPTSVSKFKRHPSMLRILDDFVDRKDEEITERLKLAAEGCPDEQRVLKVLQQTNALPMDIRRETLMKWIKGKTSIKGDTPGPLQLKTVLMLESPLIKMEKETSDILGDWADLFTDKAQLKEAANFYAPTEFTDDEIDEIHKWCTAIYSEIVDKETDRESRSEDEEKDPNEDREPPVIDCEDEAILLRLYQLKKGHLKGNNGILSYDHMMLDEVQDFSHLEAAVLLDAVPPGRPVTLAGDTAQKIDRDSGFVSWEELLRDLGARDSHIVPLQVAYRSTAEIMQLSREVLGPLAEDEPKAVRHGAPVELHRFSDPGQAVGFLGESLRDLARREPKANIAIIARHPNQARMYYDGLKKAEIPRLSLVLEQDFSFSPGVEVTEIRQVKGLEFDYVVLVDVNRDTYPDDDESRHLLHVGATRGAHQLWIFVTKTPSPILPSRLLGDDDGPA
jgi:DNA helicase-2/ATP-dependent DNA helicase PcrA